MGWGSVTRLPIGAKMARLITRRLDYEQECLECGFKHRGTTEYIGMSFWFCPKCSSMKLQIKITTLVEPKGEDDQIIGFGSDGSCQ